MFERKTQAVMIAHTPRGNIFMLISSWANRRREKVPLAETAFRRLACLPEAAICLAATKKLPSVLEVS